MPLVACFVTLQRRGAERLLELLLGFCVRPSVVCFERQKVVRFTLDYPGSDFFLAHPMASIVTSAPRRSSRSSKAGIAVISFDLASVAICPSSKSFSATHACTRCRAWVPAAVSYEPRSVLPSMATTLPAVGPTGRLTHVEKQRENSCGSSAQNTRRNVSSLGAPAARAESKRCAASCCAIRRPTGP